MLSIKKLLSIFTLVTVLSAPTFAIAGGGHSHGYTPPTDSQVIARATSELKSAIETGKKADGSQMEKIWQTVSEKSVEKKNMRYYIVSFQHPVEKKKLYVLLDGRGAFSGANFNGSFSGVN